MPLGETYPVTMHGMGAAFFRNMATRIPANTFGFVLQWFACMAERTF